MPEPVLRAVIDHLELKQLAVEGRGGLRVGLDRRHPAGDAGLVSVALAHRRLLVELAN
jgi:hypothetical protein